MARVLPSEVADRIQWAYGWVSGRGPGSVACHYRKLDPNVLMMYSSEERNRGNLPDALNGSSDRRVLAQGEVSPHLIVIGSV
jgi:hypothetical protein